MNPVAYEPGLGSSTRDRALAHTRTTFAPFQAEDEGYRLLTTWSDAGRATRVDSGPDDDVWVLSGEEILRLRSDGSPVGSATANGAREIAVDDAGRAYGLRGKAVFQLNTWGPQWQQLIAGDYHPLIGERPPYLATLAWNDRESRISVIWDIDTVAVRDYTVTGGERAGLGVQFPSHVYWDIDYRAGEAYLLNRSTNRVEVYAGGAVVADIPLPAPTERIAVGPAGTVFALSHRAWIYRLDRDGGVLDAWDATDGQPGGEVHDLTADSTGRVLAVDPNYGSVRVYALGPVDDRGVLPPPPPDDRCTVVPNKTAAPTFVRLGELTQVTLTVDGSCPQSAESVDVVLVVDRSNSMSGEKIEAARDSVVAFAEGMPAGSDDRIALVTFESNPKREVPLTRNREAIINVARGLTAEGGTNIGAAIDMAVNELVTSDRWGDPFVKPMIVLMTDGVPFNTSPLYTVAAADRARYAGIAMFTIGLGEDVNPALLRVLATSHLMYYFAPTADRLRSVYETIARRIAATFLFKTVRIVDIVPGNMRFRPDQPVDPPAEWDPTARTLTWSFERSPFRGTSMSYWLEPLEVGTWPTNVRADYDGQDGLDQPQIGPFPVPEVVVWDPRTPSPSVTPAPSATPTRTATPTWTLTPVPTDAPTPTDTRVPTATSDPPLPTLTPTDPPTIAPPTATSTAEPSNTPVPGVTPPTSPPTPASATPEPTRSPSPTPSVYRSFVPIVFNDYCLKVYTDVALVIDASTTMLFETDGGVKKIHAAKEAAKAFLHELSLSPDMLGRHDQAAIIWYNDKAGVVQPLTHDLEALERAIDSIEPVEGSRIDLGIESGHLELLPAFSPARKPWNVPALVLLSDGIPNRTSIEAVVTAADNAKYDGIEVHAVGLGRDLWRHVLQRIASQPEMYYESPSGDDLASIYRAIAGDLVCR